MSAQRPPARRDPPLPTGAASSTHAAGGRGLPGKRAASTGPASLHPWSFQLRRRLTALLAALVLALPPAHASAATPPPAASLASVLALPAELRAALQEQVLAAGASPRRRFERLVRFVFTPEGLGMDYAAEATHTVAESWATRRANCVGFTLLFIALAREAGFDAVPREIRHTLSWYQNGDTLFRSGHVNALIKVAGRDYVVDVARNTVVARHDPVTIADNRLLAHFHNNLAIGALARGDLDAAHALMQQALQADPDYAPLWSNAGVIALRRGDAAAAEAAYHQALARDPQEPSALRNLAIIARRQGDLSGERDYRRRLDEAQSRDALHHYLLGLESERAGADSAALVHFRNAIRFYKREPRFHAALARVYQRVGDRANAEKASARAQRLASRLR